MIVTIEVPVGLEALYPNEPSLARAALAALSDPSVWNLPSAPSCVAATVLTKIFMPSGLAGKSEIELADVLVRVMQAHTALAERSASTTTTALPLPLSALQTQMLEGVLDGVGRGQIVFAEGSTGMGKTRVICYAAAAAAKAAVGSDASVVIAVPTVSLVTQVISSFEKLETGITPAVLFGRGQFVDPDIVLALLEAESSHFDDETAAAIRAWLANGDRQLKQWLEKDGTQGMSLLDIPYLRDSLLAIVPDLSMAGLTHSRDVQSRAETAYQAVRCAATTARVVVTTHAMIASQIRDLSLGRTGTQLNTHALFVDEAHQFASAVESAFSQGLSLFSLRHTLRSFSEEEKRHARAIKCVERMLALIESCIQRLKGMYSGQSTILLADRTREVVAMIVAGLNAEAGGLKRLNASIPASIKDVANALAGDKAPVILTFSPVRHLPTITAGPRSLSKPLAAYWSAVQSAALFSGTLYAPTKAGWSPDWVRAELAIPDERKMALPRFVEPWVYDPVLHIPSPKVAALLVPPTNEIDLEKAYFDAVSAIILDTIYPTARGGVLVLCTSFTAIDELSQRLDTIQNLITQKGGGFSSARAKFKALDKPVWLATGAAWTGLDLVAPTDPSEDFLLTDVVIVRIPFRFAETPLAQARFQRLGMSAVRIDGSFKMRQGIGRLQRRKGSTNRRLWVLDGRLTLENPAHTFLLSPIKRVLADYRNAKFFGETS